MKNSFLFVFALGTVLLFSGCADNIAPETPVAEQVELQDFVFVEQNYDFGVIKQSGGKVAHNFQFVYNGTEPVTITGVPTSCACTSAKVSPTKLVAGDSGILTVTFNPNLHAEPEGKFFKTVSLLTEPELPAMPEVKIWVEIELDLGAAAFELQSDHEDEEEEEDGREAYTSITPEKFAAMLADRSLDKLGTSFTLIDVHTPEQKHIAGTDLVVPYNKIEQNLSQLPTDKNAKIVLYCRSGAMSRAAAYQLAEEGYTNIFDLVGGKQAYDDFTATTR